MVTAELADTWQRVPQDGTWEVAEGLVVVAVDLVADFPAVAAGLVVAGVVEAGSSFSGLTDNEIHVANILSSHTTLYAPFLWTKIGEQRRLPFASR